MTRLMTSVKLWLVALAVLVSTSILESEPWRTATTECSATFAVPPAVTPPGAPSNLRVIRTLLEALWDDDVISGPNAGEDFLEPAALPEGPHSYFEALASRADCVASYSLRDPAQITRYKHGTYAGVVSYNPLNDPHPLKQDGAKFYWPEGAINMTQLRLPIGLRRPGRVLITLDVLWDEAWLTGAVVRQSDGSYKRLEGFKFLQVTRDNEAIWMEPQQRFIAYEPGTIGRFGVRAYNTVYAPTVKGGPTVKFGDYNHGSDSVGPMLADFAGKPNTWTRFYIQIDERATETDRAYVSYWVADERRDAVQILKDAALWSGAGNHGYFWIEWNTSQTGVRVGPPMTAYVRNVVMLKNVADPTTLFARPTK